MLMVYGNQAPTGCPSLVAGLNTHSAASSMRRRLNPRSEVGGSKWVESGTTRPTSFTNTHT